MADDSVFNERILTTQLQNTDQSQLQSIDPNFVSSCSRTPLSQNPHVSEKLQERLKLTETTPWSPAVDHSLISAINTVSDDVLKHVDVESKNAINADRDNTANALSGNAISAASNNEVNTNSDTAVTINSDNAVSAQSDNAGSSIDAVTVHIVYYNNANSSSMEDKNSNKRTGTKRKRDRGEKFEYEKEPYTDEEQEKKRLKAVSAKENRESHKKKVKKLEMRILDLEDQLKARGETSNASASTATTAAANIQENVQSLSQNNLSHLLQFPDNDNNQNQECISKALKEENEHLRADNANLVNYCNMIINECNNKDGIITELNERINLIEQELTQKKTENEALKIKNTDQEKIVVQQNNNLESLKQELDNYKLVVEILRSKLNVEFEEYNIDQSEFCNESQ